jgi:hypothetical protein
MHDWTRLFEVTRREPALAPLEARRQIEQLSAPLSASELAELAGVVGCPEEALRTQNPVAQHGFPEELLDLYRWCDGGDLTVGDRRFEPLLRLGEIREYLLAYGVIHWLPGCIPFAMDGGGCFYLLDVARPSPCVRFGGMNELDSPGSVGQLSETFDGLFTDRRAPIHVL